MGNTALFLYPWNIDLTFNKPKILYICKIQSIRTKQTTDKRNNENLPWKNELKNLQKIPIKIVFFHSDMAISKSDYTIFNKELPTIKNTLNSYFGVDVELIKEISKRMNFTPEIMQPSDDMAYGFRVR